MASDGSVVIDILGDDSEFSSTIDKLGSAAGTAITAITTAVTAATTAVGWMATAAIDVGKEFETSLAGTSTMFGDVDVDTAGLTDQILELSSETGLAATDISSSLYNALSAGIPVTEDMTGAMEYMESSAMLAAAGFTDIDTAVSATAKVMNAYGMELTDVDSIQTVMLQTQNKGITTVDELGASLANVTPTAAAMSVSFENVGASLATMTAQGTGTAQATTQLNSLIAELGKSGTDAAMALQSAAEGTEYAGMSFTEMMDAGVPLNEVLDLMDVYASESDLSMIDLFSSLEAGKAALALAGDNSATYAENLAAMSTEADVVAEAYEKVTDTLDTKIAILTESVTNLGIAAYGGMETNLKDAASLATEWVGSITDAFNEGGLEGAVSAVGSVLADVIEYVVSLAPEMLEAGVSLLKSLITGISDSLPEIATGAVDIVVTLVNSIIELIPMLLDVGLQAIVAIVTGIADNIDQIVESAVLMIVSIVEILTNADTLSSLIQASFAIIMGIVDGLIAAMPELIEATPIIIESIIEVLVENLPLLVDAAAYIIVAIIEGIVENLPAILSAGMQIIEMLVEGIYSMVSDVNDAFGELINDICVAIATTDWLTLGANIISVISDGIQSKYSWFIDDVLAIATSIVDAFNSIDWANIGDEIINGIWDGIQSGWSWLTGKIESLASSLLSAAKSVLGIASPSKAFAEIGKFTMDGFGEGIEDGSSKAEEAILDEITSLSKDMEDALTQDVTAEFSAQLVKQMQAVVNTEVRKVGATTAATTEANTVANDKPDPGDSNGNGTATETDVNITFGGNLSQLARVLQPEIVKETRRKGG